LVEAKALLDAGHYDGAYYLAGYAVQCALKACIARMTQAEEFPDRKRAVDSYTHNLEALVVVADLVDSLANERVADSIFTGFWYQVRDWSENSRYDRWNRESATELYRAIVDVEHGVLRWLRRHW